jgi:hypothetical protein
MSKLHFYPVAFLAVALAFSLIIPHPAYAADQNVTLAIEGMT